MIFQIIREIKVSGENKRKVYAEWRQDQIERELEKKLPGAADALKQVVEEFKKLSISIP